MNPISFSLKPLPPFRLDLTVWVLRRRAENIWDRWDGRTYRRVLVLNGRAAEVAVTQTGPPKVPELKITVTGPRIRPEIQKPLTAVLERMLGLKTDLADFYRLAQNDSQLKPLAQKFRGLKPPCYPTVFEGLVNAITCQQFTLTAGIRLLCRLVARWGMPFRSPQGLARAFPRPEDLAALKVEDLRKLGYSRQKARSLIDLAGVVAEESFDLEKLDSLKDGEALERLTQLQGVGRWTAEYALLRGLGRVHVFPGDDVGVRNRLKSWLRVEEPLDYQGVHHILTRWKPYGGMVYFLLLLKGLEEAGHLSFAEGRS